MNIPARQAYIFQGYQAYAGQGIPFHGAGKHQNLWKINFSGKTLEVS